MRSPTWFQIVLVALALVGCDSNSVPLEAGAQLRIVPFFQSSGTVGSSTAARVDLGNIGRSTDFYFSLINDGEDWLSNVRLSLVGDTLGVAVYPDEFATIPPKGEALAPTLVRIGIDHGYSLQSGIVDYRQSPGILNVTLNLDVLGDLPRQEPQFQSLNLFANVLLTDLAFLDDRGEFDLHKPKASVLQAGSDADGFVKYYVKQGALRAVNIGNVHASIQHVAWNYLMSYELAPGDTIQVMEANQTGWIKISPEHAFVNDSRFDVQSNGYSYVYFSRS